jgi:soluble lytic murein transglycosylase-like protein
LKLKLVALTLIAIVCWLVPLKTLAQETYKPKVETKTKPSEPYVSENILIKDNALQPRPNSNRPQSPKVQLARPTYSGRYYSQEEIQQLIRAYSAQYGIPAEVPTCIARLESGFNQFARNKSSSASGVFQYLSGTWKATDEGKAGYSVFDAEANVRAAIKYMASRKSTKPWVVGPRCPSIN